MPTFWIGASLSLGGLLAFILQKYAYLIEQKLGKIFGVFAVLAIFIACLGLLGLAAYTAEQRTKELGVRKVMGASVYDLVGLLNRDFTRLVIISFIIGHNNASLSS